MKFEPIGDCSDVFDVSVVIPLHNKAEFVRSTVESVLAQTHPANEIIIIDDGSTDGSLEKIRDLVGLRIVSQQNSGPSAARNRGVAEARGSWVAFLDADDLWAEDHLATLAEVSRAFPDASILGSNFELGDVPYPTHAPVAASSFDLFTAPAPFFTSSVAVRRSVLERSGGFGDFWPGEDVELWARLALDHEVAVSTRKTAVYRQRTGGLMDRSAGLYGTNLIEHPIVVMLNAALADKKYSSRHEALVRYRDSWLANFARQAIVAGRPKIALAYLRQMQPGSRRAGMITRFLARLPNFLVRAAMGLWSSIPRRGRR